MKFPFFASFIIFILWLRYEMNKHKKLDNQTSEDFWEREARANATRRKSLDDLEYISIPFDRLPMQTMAKDESVKEYHQILESLSEQKIVNFTGLSNTDLKLQYGAPNLYVLTAYDQAYTMLARTLQQWGQLLYDNGYINDCQAVLEFALSTKTDVSGTYKLLATIYLANGEPEKLGTLMDTAKNLQSAMKKPIVRMLQEFDR